MGRRQTNTPRLKNKKLDDEQILPDLQGFHNFRLRRSQKKLKSNHLQLFWCLFKPNLNSILKFKWIKSVSRTADSYCPRCCCFNDVLQNLNGPRGGMDSSTPFLYLVLGLEMIELLFRYFNRISNSNNHIQLQLTKSNNSKIFQGGFITEL